MKRAAGLVFVLLAMLAFAGGAAGHQTTVVATLNGSCGSEDTFDPFGSLIKSVETCTASGHCECDGRTALSYQTVTAFPGSRVIARMTGSITATSAAGSVRVMLGGKRDATGPSHGTWTLSKVSGYAGKTFKKSGTFSSDAAIGSAIFGTNGHRVTIKITLLNWFS
ncbi:MAG: hypothetical protein WCH31_08470 [Actinomycetes bacterium]